LLSNAFIDAAREVLGFVVAIVERNEFLEPASYCKDATDRAAACIMKCSAKVGLSMATFIHLNGVHGALCVDGATIQTSGITRITVVEGSLSANDG
jgi:hypothetical protein